MEGEWALADNRKNALWDGLHDESIIMQPKSHFP